MAQQHPSLRHMPLHVVANILGKLESTGNLTSAVRAHPLFTNAFNTHRRQVLVDLVLESIPPMALPFALALVESRTTETPNDVRGLIDTLNSRRRNLAKASSAILKLSEADLREMSKVHEAVKWLTDDFAKGSIPLFKKHLSLAHTESPSAKEAFRAHRALYRYGMLCTIFCDTKRGDETLTNDECVVEFLHNFSPWVNEELLCIFQYLKRKLGRALSDVFAHDVIHGEIGMPGSFDYEETDGHMDDLLSWSLRRIRDVCQGDSYDDWSSLLAHGNLHIKLRAFEPSTHLDCLSMLRSETTINDLEHGLGERVTVVPIDPMAWETIRQKRDIDQVDGPDISDSQRLWLLNHHGTSLEDCTDIWNPAAGLKECGYVIWDGFDQECPLDSVGQKQALETRLSRIRNVDSFYDRPKWSEEYVSMSLEQRSEIWLSGGTGYWEVYQPGSGAADFSRITGLDQSKKQKLVERWDSGYIPQWSRRSRSAQNPIQ